MYLNFSFFTVFLINRNISSKIKRSKVTDYAALRIVPILKRDAIEVNHCSVQYSPFDVRNFFSILATPLYRYSTTAQVMKSFNS